MEQCIINPSRGRGEPCLPPFGILAVNPSDTGHLQALAGRFRLQRHFLFHSRLYAGPDLFIAGPAVGAPMAVICLEKLIALGARSILVHGWCGSLVPELAATDILVPTVGLPEEGTSPHYDDLPRPAPDPGLAEGLWAWLEASGRHCRRGPIWTTDAPFRETREKVEQYGRDGIMAVDMEYTALCTVAGFRSIRLAAAMLVSDELWRVPWKPVYGHKRFRALSGQLLELLVGFIRESGARGQVTGSRGRGPGDRGLV